MSEPSKIEEEIKKIETFSSRAWAWVQAGHLRTVFYVVCVIIFILGFNEIRDLQKKAALQEAEIGTLHQDFQKLGDAYIGQGEVFKSRMAAIDAAILTQGKDLTQAMQDQGNQIRATFQAQGQILAEVVKGQNTPVTPTADGGFNSLKLAQARGDGRPALTDVTMSWNPKDPNPNTRLQSSWSNNREVFHPSVIEWQKKDDKSLSGTFRLTRDVYRPDGTLVGKEDIPLTGATASFDPKAFNLQGAPRRWGLALGPVWDYKDQKWYPGGGFDYRITTNNVIQVGVTKNNAFVWWHYFVK